MIEAIVSFLNSPVPHIASTSNNGLYFIDVSGGGAIAFCLWWTLMFLIRNGIDGSRHAMRVMYRHDFTPLRMILLNNWKVHGTAEEEVGPVDLREPEVGK